MPAKMDPRQLHTRLAAALAGAAVAAAGIAAFAASLPAQSEASGDVDYGYVYSGVKSSSAAFVSAAMQDDSLLVLGSSEFSTPAALVPQVPGEVFGKNDYGIDLMLVGEAYDQSLWHTIALGALAATDGGVPSNKAVLIVAPGWFVDGGQDGETFGTRFSYALAHSFFDNDEIPDEAKAYVHDRLLELGIDETRVEAAARTLPTDALNDAVFLALDNIKLSRGLDEVRSKGIAALDGQATEPDFASMREQALAFGAEHSASNDWGVEDTFYTRQLAPVLDAVRGSRDDETYSNTPEYDDLECFLRVARSCGIDVLVVVSPVMGPYYDHIGIDAQTRAYCYGRIREICEAAGAKVADFSDREYEKYFLYDIVHFGWTGWIDVEQAILDFAREGAADGAQDL